MEALIATAGDLINVLPEPLKALTAEVVSRIKFIRLRAVAVWFTNLSVFSVLSNRAISSCNGGFGSTTWCTWHSTGLSPGSVPSLAFLLSISSNFFHLLFSKKHVCVWLSLNLSCCPFSGLVGWLCQLPSLFLGVPSMPNTARITSNLGEISRNGIPLGSFLEVFPALQVSFPFLQPSFQQEACVHVWLSLVLLCFVHFLGWLGGCVSCLFCLQGFRACRIPPKVISNLGEISRNGIALGSLLEVFPALHFSFLFLQSSFQQEACVYVWLSLVLSFFFCIFWAGWVVVSAAFFVSRGSEHVEFLKITSNLGEISRNGIPLGSLLEVFPALHSSFLFLQPSFQQEACVYVRLSLVLSCCPFSGLVGLLCQMAFHRALSWKRSQPCILPFYFFHLLFSKKHVCMFGCH